MFAVIGSASGCASESESERLAEQRAIWASGGVTDYSIEVVGLDGAASVERLFGEIDRAIAAGHDVTVDYDVELGYPRWAVLASATEVRELEVVFLQIEPVLDGDGEVLPVLPVPRVPNPHPGFGDVIGVPPQPDRPPGSQLTPIGEPSAPQLDTIAH
jgi:hypothetical protein